MTQPTCATCRWWQSNRTCRRMPPIGNSWADAQVRWYDGVFEPEARAVWPITNGNDWCGEHAPREADNGG